MDHDEHITPTHRPEQSNRDEQKWSHKLRLYIEAAQANIGKYYRQGKIAIAAFGRWIWKILNAKIFNNESLVALCTPLIVAATAVYAYYAFLQWDATRQAADAAASAATTAQRALDATIKQSRLDQRAWLSFSFASNVPLDDGKPFIQPIILTNTGKTPAKKVTGQIVSLLVRRDDIPNFSYAHGTKFPSGIGFPNAPIPFASFLIPSDLPKGAEMRPLIITLAIRQGLGTGQNFILTYGNITYEDVSGESHWLHFCRVGPQETVVLYAGAKDCYEYNDVDTKKP
ncbi:MAG: hypothetical protein HYS38_07715 [Acidobacteria bacterium]|nr:hypothetical protein [Acidobacteriota bacterium]